MLAESLHLRIVNMLVLPWLLIGFTGTLTLEVCIPQPLHISCGGNSVIAMEHAQYGRMQTGTCLSEESYIGCSNDVLFLADRWCSGLFQCEQAIPNDELQSANSECEDYLIMYLAVNYSCIPVYQPDPETCALIASSLHTRLGYLSSHVTDETGCGSAGSPWEMVGQPGQTIQLSLIDFAGETASGHVYGYVIENGNRTEIQPGVSRRREIYWSAGHEVTLVFSRPVNEGQTTAQFLIQYQFLGCADLTPPAHAWYKRKGDQAVIGCNLTQKTWHLSCDGHSWTGVVGKCTNLAVGVTLADTTVDTEDNSALLVAGVVAVTLVLVVTVLVVGLVCKQKHRKVDTTTLQRYTMDVRCPHQSFDNSLELSSAAYIPSIHRGYTLGNHVTMPRTNQTEGCSAKAFMSQRSLPAVPETCACTHNMDETEFHSPINNAYETAPI